MHRTPIEVFTGMIPSRPLMRELLVSSFPQIESVEELEFRQVLRIDRLQSILEEMHKDVSEKITKEHSTQMIAHNVKPVNFIEGSFILVRPAQSRVTGSSSCGEDRVKSFVLNIRLFTRWRIS